MPYFNQKYFQHSCQPGNRNPFLFVKFNRLFGLRHCMKRIICIWSLSVCLVCNAQKPRFFEGFIVTKANDTLNGLVYWKKNSSSQDTLFYKNMESNESKKYSWDELMYAYNKSSGQGIRICSVKISLEYIDPYNFTIKLPDSTVTETIPLSPLYIGNKLSLYQFYEKSQYFFIYDGARMQQLVQKYRYLTESEKKFDYLRAPKYYFLSEYKGLLSGYYNFAGDKKMRYMLDNSLYEEGSLYTLISKLDKKLK